MSETIPRQHTPSADQPAAKRPKEEEVKQPPVESTTVPVTRAPATGGEKQLTPDEPMASEDITGGGSFASPTSRADTKRMLEKHQEYLQAQDILSRLPSIFPEYSQQEANGFLVWLAQLPVAMHRPRPTVSIHGWKAAGEIMTCQYDEKVPSIFKKMIDNNISCLPVLDVHRRYIGIIDNMALVIHTLRCFGVMGESESAKDPSLIAIESVETESGGAAMDIDTTTAASVTPSGKADAEMKIEQIAAAGTPTATIPSAAGIPVLVKPSAPVHVTGGRDSYMSRPICHRGVKQSEKSVWGDWWDRNDFKDIRASTILSDTISALSTTNESAVIIGQGEVPNLVTDTIAAPLVQGSSTLFAIELMARMGLHRVPILNSERFITGLITESMLISLISQYKDQIPSFLSMPVKNMTPFLLPHRLVIVDEDAITVEAFMTMVRERVNGAAVVNKAGVLVDVLSSRDLRGIGRTGAEFERLWMIVAEFKETTRQEFPEKTPSRVRYVTAEDRMVDVISNFSDGNLHRVFVCEKSAADGLPRPISVITQRDVMRILLVFMAMTLQGEVRVTTA